MNAWSVLGSALVGSLAAGGTSGVIFLIHGLFKGRKRKRKRKNAAPPGKRPPPGPRTTPPKPPPGARVATTARPKAPLASAMPPLASAMPPPASAMPPPAARPKAPPASAMPSPWLVLPVVLAIVLAVPAGERVGDRLEDLVNPPATRFDSALRVLERKLRGDTELKGAFAGLGPEQARQQGMALARRGIARLDDRMLEKRAAVLLLIIQTGGEAFGAGLYAGKADPKMVQDLLSQLPPRELGIWFDIAYAAMKAEIQLTPAPAVTEVDKQTAVRKLILALGPTDGARLIGVLKSRNPSPADANWAAVTIYQRVPQMEQPYKRLLLRVFASS